MKVRRIIAFTSVCTLALVIITGLCGDVSAAPRAGTISIYFDPAFTSTELTTLEPGMPAVFYVVAEDVGPDGVTDVRFGVEMSDDAVFGGLAAVSGSVVAKVTPLSAGGTRFEMISPPSVCIPANGQTQVLLAEGYFIWMGPGDSGETIVDLGAAVRLDGTASLPTWRTCGNGATHDFDAVVDGRIGPAGGPECRLSTNVIRFGNVLAGNTTRRSLTITNAGGDQLAGEVTVQAPLHVASGAGPFSLGFSQSHKVDLDLSSATPGQVVTLVDLGPECGLAAATGTVVDPADMGQPAGVLSVYLDAASTTRAVTGATFGATHTFYVVAEDLPEGASIMGFEAALDLGGFAPGATMFNPPSAQVIGGAPGADYIVDRQTCPSQPHDLLFKVAASMVIPPDGYAVTVTPSGSAATGLTGDPVWVGCDGVIHPFASVRAAHIEYTDPYGCVRGPDEVDFGPVVPGQSRSRVVTIVNAGDSPAAGTLTSDCTAFTIVSNADYALAPHETHDVIVRFAPMGGGDYACALSGGPMCTSVLLAGRGEAARTAGGPMGAVSVYFDDGFTQNELAPELGGVTTLHVVAEGTGNLDGAELTLHLPGDMLVVGGMPATGTMRYDANGNLVVTLLVTSCRASDAAGRVELAALETLYLPLFPRDVPFTVVATAAPDSRFDPPAPGWTECGGASHPFIYAQPATVLPWHYSTFVGAPSFSRNDAGGEVALTWSAQTGAAAYRVFRDVTPGFAPGRSNLVAEITGTSFSETLPDPSRYHYRISAVDAYGIGTTASVTTAARPTAAETALIGAAPNPFNPATSIAFTLAAPAQVRLDVYDVAGRHVATLADGPFPAGVNRVPWDGRDRTGAPSASGVYFVHFRAPGVRQTTRVVLLK